jgi:hypothetical protein
MSTDAGAEAFVFNATVVPPNPLGFLTLWPDAQANAGMDIERARRRNYLQDGDRADDEPIHLRFRVGPMQLILDIAGYLAPCGKK